MDVNGPGTPPRIPAAPTGQAPAAAVLPATMAGDTFRSSRPAPVAPKAASPWSNPKLLGSVGAIGAITTVAAVLLGPWAWGPAIVADLGLTWLAFNHFRG